MEYVPNFTKQIYYLIQVSNSLEKHRFARILLRPNSIIVLEKKKKKNHRFSCLFHLLSLFRMNQLLCTNETEKNISKTHVTTIFVRILK